MFNVGDMRIEMGRLTQVMLAKNRAYVRREAELEQLYADKPLVLKQRLEDDYQLTKASNGAKTCAVLITALAAVISAEIAYVEHQQR